MEPIKLLRPARLAFLALVVLPFAVCVAQDKPAAETVRAARPEIKTISIDFPGGPMSKLVASLNKEELSVMQPVGVDPVLPAFALREARVDAFVYALARLLEPQGYNFSLAGNMVGANLAVLVKRDDRGSQGFASFQLESKINARSGRTADDVIAAIQMGCEFANPGQPSSTLRFKYHPGTKLLFVSGTRQEIDVAHQVYGSLPEGPGERQPPAPDKK